MIRAVSMALVGVVVGMGLGCGASPSVAPSGGDAARGPEALAPTLQFVRGVITGAGQPLANARIRVQGQSDRDHPAHVESAVDGSFFLSLAGHHFGDGAVVTVGAIGFRSSVIALPPVGGAVAVALESLGADDPTYAFTSALAGPARCSPCHLGQVAQWSTSQHGAAATDPTLLDEQRRHLAWWQRLDPAQASDDEIFSGALVSADRKGDSGRRFSEGSQRFLVVGDGAAASDCAKCHAPTFALAGGVDLREATAGASAPVDAEGVGCDVCHRIAAVKTASEHDLVSAGIDKVEFARPSPGGGAMLGPFDDVVSATMPSSFAPLENSSEFCAACHSDGRSLVLQPIDDRGLPEGNAVARVVWGEDTFREWRFAPGSLIGVEPTGGGDTYAASGDGPFFGTGNYAGRPLGCVDCHMRDPPPDPVTGERIGAFRDPALGDPFMATHAEAIARDPRTLHAHRMEGRSPRFIAFATELSASAKRVGERIEVYVRVENRHTGHAFPSGLPDRNAILLVEASDGSGPLAETDGPEIPWWATGDGQHDPGRDLAGRAGRGYARVLVGADGEAPAFYLRAVKAGDVDSRLRAGDIDETNYGFAAHSGAVRVRVSLRHRLRFKAQSDRYLARFPAADRGGFETVGDVIELALP